MTLPLGALTGEYLTGSDGLKYEVINTEALDFEGPDATWGKKTSPTRVRIGRLGEVIQTNPGGFDETPPYTVEKEGELIFINTKPDGTLDIYAPPNAQAVLDEHYTLVGGDINSDEGAVYRPTMRPVRILHQVNDTPICIKNAHGQDRHAFFRPGATLKLQDGKVSGIEKSAFDFTWKQTDTNGRILQGTDQIVAGRD